MRPVEENYRKYWPKGKYKVNISEDFGFDILLSDGFTKQSVMRGLGLSTVNRTHLEQTYATPTEIRNTLERYDCGCFGELSLDIMLYENLLQTDINDVLGLPVTKKIERSPFDNILQERPRFNL